MVESTAVLSSEAPDAALEPAASLGDGKSASQLEFIEEIRTNRLTLLWKATLATILGFVWFVLLISGGAELSVIDLLLPTVAMVIASLATRHYLQIGLYSRATWAYALGVLLTISVLMIPDTHASRELVPALGVVIIFVIGMLMSVQQTFTLLGISYLLMLGMPLIFAGDVVVTDTSVFIFVLMALAAMLVTQVSGELFTIADWAIENYRKERKTATKLHESRLELEKSLLKQKNLTLQVQRTNEDLAEAREAAEIAKQFRGQFLANMSHELRTPLNAIIGFSETMLNFPMMYDGVELPSEYRQDLERIFGSGKHLLGIINDILDLSKIDVGRLELEIQPVDLQPIIKGLLSTAVGLVGTKPVELHRELPAELPTVMGDPLRIRQVLLNLYSNAAKFTEEGHIKLMLIPEPERVVMAVEDTGPGIDRESVERIFEAFQQGESGRKQKRAGAGLGLAICQQLLDLMDGDVWVDSEVGKGSTFYISLPRYYPTSIDEEWTDVGEADGVV